MNDAATWLETILRTSGYAGIFLLMAANGAISFPSSQILYLIAGYFSSLDFFSPIVVVFFGALGNTIGNAFLYEITAKYGLARALKLNVLPETTFKKLSSFLEGHGIWFLFVGKLIPAIKVAVPIAAGLARTKRALTYIIFFVASLAWASIFVSVGFFFGKSTAVMSTYGVSVAFIAIAISVLLYSLIGRDAKEKSQKELAHIEKTSPEAKR